MVHILSNQLLFDKFKRINPTRNTHPKQFLEGVENLLDEVISNGSIEVVGGHFGYNAHPCLSDPAMHFTMLRDPVDRVISEYYYMKHKGMYYQKLILEEELSLYDYLWHEKTFYLNNLQTRLIAGESYTSGDQVGEPTFLKALDNLKKFGAFGLTEEMNNSLALFYLTLKWKRLPYALRSNVNERRTKRDKVDEKTIKSIEERERYDIKLYNEATKIFEKRLRPNEAILPDIINKIKDPGYLRKIYFRSLKAYHKLRGVV